MVEATAAGGPCGRRECSQYERLEEGQEAKPGEQGGWRNGWNQTTGCLLGQEKSFHLIGRELETIIIF